MQVEESPLKRVLADLAQADSKLSGRVEEKVLLLFGRSKSGKTTLLYHLEGLPLERIKDETAVWRFRPLKELTLVSVRSHHERTTIVPNVVAQMGQEEVTVIDMPSFDDLPPHYQLINLYSLRKVIERCKKVHVVQVISEESLNSADIEVDLENLCGILSQQFLKQDKAFSFVLTKMEDEGVIEEFKELLQQLHEVSPLAQILESGLMEQNVYLFMNKQTNSEEGSELKRQIIADNSFIQVGQAPQAILSADHQTLLVPNSQEMTEYVFQLTCQVHLVTTVYLKVTLLAFHCQFSTFFANSHEMESQDYHQQQLKRLTDQLAHIKEFIEVQVDTRTHQDMKYEQWVLFLESWFVPSSSSSDIVSILDTFLNKIVRKVTLKKDLLGHQELWVCLDKLGQGLTNIFRLVQQLNLSEVNQKVQVLNEEPFAAFLRQYSEQYTELHPLLANSQSLHQFKNDPQIEKLLEIHGIKMAEVAVVKQSQMTRIALHKQIDQLLKKGPQVEVARMKEPIQEFMTVEDINSLDNTAQSFGSLLSLLSARRQTLKQLLGPVLNKISVVCYALSWFEEAVVFQMAAGNHQGVEYFTKAGQQLGYLSVDFVESVLLPYCRGIKTRWKLTQLCHSYLMSQGTDLEYIQEYEFQYQKDLSALANPRKARAGIDLGYVQQFMQNCEQWTDRAMALQRRMRESKLGRLRGFIKQQVKQDIHSRRND